MSHHTCKELGVCKCAAPVCQDTTVRPLRLAPGVVEGHKVGLLGSPAQRRELVRYLRHLAAWGAVLIVCGLLVGVMSGVRP